MIKIFIDGRNGTTGLRIDERLFKKKNIQLLTLPEELRKEEKAKREILNAADIVFLCLPDEAAKESVSWIKNPTVKVIDTSTAHRTNPDWAYGFPELDDAFYYKIQKSKRIAVPGCHASGFIALIYPLIKNEILDRNAWLSCTSLTGYSGGGKKMIAEYEKKDRLKFLDAPRTYGIGQEHKHLKEMKEICHLAHAPAFMPIVGDFYSGMESLIALNKENLKKGGMAEIKEIYKTLYRTKTVFYNEENEEGFLSAKKMSGKDGMEISVFGNEERILLTARYDNLGKGASGAAIECLNILTDSDLSDTLVLD